MPIPVTGDFIKVSLGGAIATERWSINLWLQYVGGILPTPAQMNVFALAVLNGFNTQTWNASSNSLKLLNSTDTTLDSCKISFYRGGVLVVNGTAGITAVPGTGTQPHPAYVAMVCTLYSTFPGRSKRGRLYLPTTAVNINSATSQMASTVNQDGLALNMWNFLATSNVLAPTWDLSGTNKVVIMSQHLGSVVQVSSIKIDSLPDTQHGRSRKLIATHSSVQP